MLTPEEVGRLLALIEGTAGLILRLLYGTGMRIMECLRLRVKDVDFARGEILVREGKGAKDRVTLLPNTLAVPLKSHLARVQALHDEDLAAGCGEVWVYVVSCGMGLKGAKGGAGKWVSFPATR